MTSILLVDDQRSLRRSLALMLQNAGFGSSEATSGPAALAILDRSDFDLVITDLKMEGMSGVDLLREIKVRRPALPVIIITAYGSIESAVDAMRLGAFDYLTKPFGEAEIIEKIRSCLVVRDSRAARDKAEGDPSESHLDDDLVATNAQMRATMIRVSRIAATDISVLMTGETGTGKTRIARLIHDKSARSEQPFVSINCASLPEQLLESELFGHVKGSFTGAVSAHIGLFEAANRGTIFLDEIDTLSLAMQAKLLYAVQERKIRPVGSSRTTPVDIRVISASNQDLTALIERGAFRSDLYFRMNGIRLHLPPLRERGDDLRRLLDRFLKIHAKKHGRNQVSVTRQALAYIMAYSFPGNIRQLDNLVEQMVVFADDAGIIDVDVLPEEILSGAQTAPRHSIAAGQIEVTTFADSERSAIEAALRKLPHIGDAARELGMARTTLWRRMKQYKLEHLAPARRRKW